jgi:MarC family integral membrane protein
LVWLCYGNAGKLVKFLGPTGTTIVTRLSSFILMAIGVQIMCNGVSSVMRTRLPNAEDRISHLLSAALISPEHQEQDSRVAYPGQHEPVIGDAPYWPKETPPSILHLGSGSAYVRSRRVGRRRRPSAYPGFMPDIRRGKRLLHPRQWGDTTRQCLAGFLGTSVWT